MYLIPVWGLGAVPMTAQMKELIVNSPPSAINGQIDRELEVAGVERSIRVQFRYSTAFTTVQRLHLMEQFRALEGVRNRTALIAVAAAAHNEAEALSAIRKGKMLADTRERQPIRLLESVGLLPLAVLDDGTHVLICPYDYLRSTREVDDYIDAYRASNPNVATVLVTAGRLSPAVLKKIESAHITVVEEKALVGDRPSWIQQSGSPARKALMYRQLALCRGMSAGERGHSPIKAQGTVGCKARQKAAVIFLDVRPTI